MKTIKYKWTTLAIILSLITTLLPNPGSAIAEAKIKSDIATVLTEIIENENGRSFVDAEKAEGRSLPQVHAATKRAELKGISYEQAAQDLYSSQINPSKQAVSEARVDESYTVSGTPVAVEASKAYFIQKADPAEEQTSKDGLKSKAAAKVQIQSNTSPPELEQPPVYTHGSIGQAPFSVGRNQESVSTLTGSLNFMEVDLSLPGRNGLSFELMRQYNSDHAQYHNMDYSSSTYEYNAPFYYVEFDGVKKELNMYYDVYYTEYIAIQTDSNGDGVPDDESPVISIQNHLKGTYSSHSAATQSKNEGFYYSGTAGDSKTVTSSLTKNIDSFTSSIAYSYQGYTGTLYKSGASEIIGGTYTPSDSKTETDVCINKLPGRYKSNGEWEQTAPATNPCPSSKSYNSGGYSGTLDRTTTTTVKACTSPGTPNWTCTKEYHANYSGLVTKPAIDTRTWRQHYSGTVTRQDTRTTVKYGPWLLDGNYGERYVYWVADTWIDERVVESSTAEPIRMITVPTFSFSEANIAKDQVDNKTYPVEGTDGEYNYYYASPTNLNSTIMTAYIPAQGIYYHNTTSVPTVEKLYPIGKGWSWNIPYMETRNGKQYITLTDGGTYEVSNGKLKDYPWEGVSLTTDISVTVNSEQSSFRLSSINGTLSQYFSNDGRLLQIEDAYGNTIKFKYQQNAVYGRKLLSEIEDAAENKISFAYSQEEVTLTKGDQVVVYEKYNQGGKEVLSAVTDVEGRKSTYSYRFAAATFNLMSYAPERALSNPYALLEVVQHPTGAQTHYEWRDIPVSRKIGSSSVNDIYYLESRKDVILYENDQTEEYNRQNFNITTDIGATWGEDATITSSVDNFLTSTVYRYKKDYINSNITQYYLEEQETITPDRIFTVINNYTKLVGSNTYPVAVPTSVTVSDNLTADELTSNRVYNDYGNLVQETDVMGRVSSYTYDSKQLLATVVTQADTNDYLHTSYTRNIQGDVTKIEVRANNASGELLQQINYLDFDAFGNIGRVTVQNENGTYITTEFEYSAAYNHAYLTKQSRQATDADHVTALIVTEAAYDMMTGNMIGYTDGRGYETSFSYDKLGRVGTISYPDDETYVIAYDDLNNTVTTTDETNKQARVKFDPLGHKVSVGIVENDNYLPKEMTEYDLFGRVSATQDALGNRKTYTYDEWGRVTSQLLPGGRLYNFYYDDGSRQLTIQDPENYEIVESYDEFGRKVETQERINAEAALQTLERVQYHQIHDEIQAVTDGNNQTTVYNYDLQGRLTSVTNALNETTGYTYDRMGKLIEIAYPDQTAKTYKRDELGRIIQTTDEEGRVTTHYYDANGNMVVKTDRNTVSSQMSYDKRNRLSGHVDPDSTIWFTYDDAGRRLSMADDAGTTTYSYGEVEGYLEKVVYPDGLELVIDYDVNGNRTKLTDPFGVETHYQYDALNRLSQIGTSTAQSEITYDYYANSFLKERIDANGMTSAYQFTGRDLTELSHLTGNQNMSSRYAYAYDANKNIISRTVEREGAVHTQNTFTYDELSRIETSSIFNEMYHYDVRGNRTTMSSDEDFNLSDASYTYNAKNQLEGVNTDGQQVSYLYNGDGLLVEREQDGETTRYYYDGPDIIAEAKVINGQPEHVASYVRGHSLELFVYNDDSKAYAYANGHGDIMELRDEQGQLLNSYDYDLWGNVITENEQVHNPFRYSGELWDEVAQLQYLRARWYDPSTGRFLTEDTYEGQINNPLSLNLYTYVANNPLIYIDPSGNRWRWLGDVWELVEKAAVETAKFLILDDINTLADPNSSWFDKTMAAMSFIPTGKAAIKAGQLWVTWQSTKTNKVLTRIYRPCNCFTAGTKVLTDKGEKNIEDIEVGDRVLAKSDETGEVAYKEVVGLFKKQADEIYKVYIGDEVIEATSEHPFWLDGKGWTEVKDLKVGNLLVTSGGATLAVDKIEKEPREATVYNFEVADFHSYFVSSLGIWVHNCFTWTGTGFRNLARNNSPNDLIKNLEDAGWTKTIEAGGRRSGDATIFVNSATGMKVRIHANPGEGTPYFRVQNRGGGYLNDEGVFPSNATSQELRDQTHFYFGN